MSENVFLLHAVIMGVFITFIYDILRIARRVFAHGEMLVSLEDLIFWIYCAIEVFLLMCRLSDGMLRWFAVLGALTGMFLYKKLVSPYFVKYISLLLCRIKELLGRILSFLLKPFRMVFRKARHILKKIMGKMARRASRLKPKRKGILKKKLTLLLKVLKMTI